MPPGSKKRKALKKKQQEQVVIGPGTNNKGFNGRGDVENGSQDERDSDSNLSSPGSQGNEEFGTRELSPPPLSGLGKATPKEETDDADATRGQGAKGKDVVSAVRLGTDHEKNGVDKPPNSFPENSNQYTREAASQEASGSSTLEILPAVDSVKPVGSSVSKVVISDKNERVERSAVADSVQHKSEENEEKRRLKEAKEGGIQGPAVETSKEIKNLKESEVPECSKEKSLLPSGPPVVRTSWLSCCGLFDVMAGSER